jgi:cytochrome b subunit of formate dehydrogenase
MVHSVVAVLCVAAMLGHVYIGTLGMEGDFEATGSGEVDPDWPSSITACGWSSSRPAPAPTRRSRFPEAASSRPSRPQ